jgi:hypothetical protein
MDYINYLDLYNLCIKIIVSSNICIFCFIYIISLLHVRHRNNKIFFPKSILILVQLKLNHILK